MAGGEYFFLVVIGYWLLIIQYLCSLIRCSQQGDGPLFLLVNAVLGYGVDAQRVMIVVASNAGGLRVIGRGVCETGKYQFADEVIFAYQ